jgi:RNA polymerase sigma-70 factor (ECF subfamily)
LSIRLWPANCLRRDNKQSFEMIVVPHVDAGYNLARHLLRNDQDAEDAVQTAALRAFQSIESYRGGDSKAWFLAIVRRSSLNVMRQKHPMIHWDDGAEEELPDLKNPDPEQFLMRTYEADRVNRALALLPPGLREMIVLREVEGMAYKEIASVIDHPIGTVMSRLAKARQQLQKLLMEVDS